MKKSITGFLSFALFFVIIQNVLYAQENDSTKTTVKKDTSQSNIKTATVGVSMTATEKVKDALDTTAFSVNEIKVIGYPYAFYSPETELAFGLGGMIYFRTALQPSQRPSKITVSGYYTTNNQYNVSIKPRIYFPGPRRFYAESNFYFSYDILKYYGLGNSTPDIDTSANYKSNSFGIYVETQAKGFVVNELQIGLIYDYLKLTMKDKMSNPYLQDSTVKGTNGGKVGGLGLTWNLDTRDNISYPSKGGFYKISGIFYGKDLGGDFTYNRYKLDFRQYIAPYKDHILAFQFYSDLNAMNPPWFAMPALGGGTIMRGYFEGRYRDKGYMAWQAEYRKIVWWRIGVTAFYSTGDVFSHFSRLKLTEMKHSYGFGLRFVFDPKEKINLRADFGKTKNGDSGVYFSMDEAF
jgi:hypothetical protein